MRRGFGEGANESGCEYFLEKRYEGTAGDEGGNEEYQHVRSDEEGD